MTYPATNPVVQYKVSVAGQTLFNGTFKIFTQQGVKVYRTPNGQPADEVNDLLGLDVDYTVDISEDGNTFDVTLSSGASIGDIIILALDEPIQRESNLVNGGAYQAELLDFQLDLLTSLIAKVDAKLEERGLTYSDVDYVPNLGQKRIPVLQGGQIWKANAEGNIVAVTPEEDPDCSTLRSEIESRSMTAPGTDVSGSYLEKFGGGQSLTDAIYHMSDENRFNLTSGTSTEYSLILSGLSGYYNGLAIEVYIHVTNGANPTLNINGIGAIPIADQDGNPLNGGELLIGSNHRFIKVNAQFRTYTTLQPASSDVHWNYRSTGSKIYQDVTDPLRNIGFSTGQFADSTNQKYIKQLSPIYKQTNAAWAEGNGQGGMPPALLPFTNKGCNCFSLIKTSVPNPGVAPAPVGTIDAGFDDAWDAANLMAYVAPLGYTLFRYRGNRYINATSQIVPAITEGNVVLFDRAQVVRPLSSIPSILTEVDLIYTPTGRKVMSILSCRTSNNGGGSETELIIGDKLTHVVENDNADISNIQYLQPSGPTVEFIGNRQYIITDLNRKIQFMYKFGGNCNFKIAVLGYFDFIND